MVSSRRSSSSCSRRGNSGENELSSGIESMFGLRMVCNCNNDNNKEWGNFNNMREREIIMIRRSMSIQDSSKPFVLCR